MEGDEALRLLQAGKITIEEFNKNFSITPKKPKKKGRPRAERKAELVTYAWIKRYCEFSKVPQRLAMKKFVKDWLADSKNIGLEARQIDRHIKSVRSFSDDHWPTIQRELLEITDHSQNRAFVRKAFGTMYGLFSWALFQDHKAKSFNECKCHSEVQDCLIHFQDDMGRFDTFFTYLFPFIQQNSEIDIPCDQIAKYIKVTLEKQAYLEKSIS